MEHESHLPESSMMSMSIKIFGGAVALVLLGGLLYVAYIKSGLDPSATVADAYDECKDSVLSTMARTDKVQFINTPATSTLVKDGNGYMMVMKLSVTDRAGQRTVSYNCAVSGGFMKQIEHFFW